MGCGAAFWVWAHFFQLSWGLRCGLPPRGVHGMLGFGASVFIWECSLPRGSTRKPKLLDLAFVSGVRPCNSVLSLHRYALHFLVQSGISYCIMIGVGVEAMHK